MQSPLPDSSNLEAGLVADQSLAKSTSVQDHIRSLLRSSILMEISTSSDWDLEQGSISTIDHSDVLPLFSARPSMQHVDTREGIPSGQPTAPEALCTSNDLAPVDQKLSSTPEMVVHCHHNESGITKSTSRSRLPRHRSAWRRNHAIVKRPNVQAQVIICIASALFLGALLAIYLSQLINEPRLALGYHVLFILSLIATMIVFSHSLLRLLLVPSSHSFARTPASSRSGRRRHCLHAHIPPSPLDTYKEPDFLTGSPIASPVDVPVHMSHPVIGPFAVVGGNAPAVSCPLPSTPTRSIAGHANESEQAVQHPPPAYGRWRGSVRIDPALVHHLLPVPLSPISLNSPSHSPWQSATEEHGSPPTYTSSLFGEMPIGVRLSAGGQHIDISVTNQDHIPIEMVQLESIEV